MKKTDPFSIKRRVKQLKKIFPKLFINRRCFSNVSLVDQRTENFVHFADDIVIFSKNYHKLQKLLNEAEQWEQKSENEQVAIIYNKRKESTKYSIGNYSARSSYIYLGQKILMVKLI